MHKVPQVYTNNNGINAVGILVMRLITCYVTQLLLIMESWEFLIYIIQMLILSGDAAAVIINQHVFQAMLRTSSLPLFIKNSYKKRLY